MIQLINKKENIFEDNIAFVEKRLDEAQYPVKAYRTLIAISWQI